MEKMSETIVEKVENTLKMKKMMNHLFTLNSYILRDKIKMEECKLFAWKILWLENQGW